MARKLRMIADAAELSEDDRYCTECSKPLKGKMAWLELDQRSGCYHDFGGVPEDKSQGWFPFGITCAKALISRAEVAATPDPHPHDGGHGKCGG